MSDRKDEINTVLAFIQSVCEKSNIALIAKDFKGKLCVVVVDGTDGKQYVIARGKEECQ